jgi:hypothetical protein
VIKGSPRFGWEFKYSFMCWKKETFVNLVNYPHKAHVMNSILCILQDKTLSSYMILPKGGSSTSMICVCNCVSFLLWCPNLILFQKAFINWKQPLQVLTRCKANIPITTLPHVCYKSQDKSTASILSPWSALCPFFSASPIMSHVTVTKGQVACTTKELVARCIPPRTCNLAKTGLLT